MLSIFVSIFYICLQFNQNILKLDNSKLGSTQQQKICWHWHVARIISSQKIYGFYGRKHHKVEMRGDVTDAGRPNNEQLKIELLSQWKLEAESRNFPTGESACPRTRGENQNNRKERQQKQQWRQVLGRRPQQLQEWHLWKLEKRLKKRYRPKKKKSLKEMRTGPVKRKESSVKLTESEKNVQRSIQYWQDQAWEKTCQIRQTSKLFDPRGG